MIGVLKAVEPQREVTAEGFFSWYFDKIQSPIAVLPNTYELILNKFNPNTK